MGASGAGGVTPTLAAAGREMPAADAAGGQVETENQDLAGIHMVESKLGPG